MNPKNTSEPKSDIRRLDWFLAQTPSLIRDILDVAAQPILILSTEQQVEYANPALAGLLGYSSQDLLGQKPPFAWWPQDNPENSLNPTGDCTRPDIQNRRFSFVKRGGETLWAKVSSHPISYNGRQLICLSFERDAADASQDLRNWKQSEAIFRSIVQSSGEAIVLIEGDRLCFANPRALTLSGFSQSELSSRSYWEFVHERDRELVRGKVARALAGQADADPLEFRYLNKGGETRWLSGVLSRAAWEDGYALAAFLDDITNRKLARENLRLHEKMINASQDAISLLDGNYRYQVANHTYSRYTGLAKEEIIGRTVSEVLGRNVFENYAKANLDRALAGESVHFQYWIDTQAKGRIFWDAYYAPYCLDDGKPSGVMITARDITTQKKIEKTLEGNETRLRRILSASSDGWWEKDLLSGNWVWSDSLYRLLGYQPGEVDLSDDAFWRLVHPDDHSAARECLAHSLDGKDACDLEVRFLRKSGKWRWLHVRGEMVTGDDSSSPARFLGTVVDIDQRKSAEEILKRYKFMADSTHDFMSIINREYCYEGANDSYLQAAGLSREKVIGQSVSRVWSESSSYATIKSALDRCFTGETVRYLTWLEFRDRGLGCYDVIYHPYSAEGRETTHAVMVSHEVTKFIEAERKLAQSQERLELSITGSQDGLFDWYDPVNDQAWLSPRIYELLGYEPDDLTPSRNTFMHLVYPDDRDSVLAVRDAHFGQKAPYDVECRLRSKKGSYRWFRIRGQARWDSSGGVERFSGSLQDIHARKVAEQALREARAVLEQRVAERTAELQRANLSLQREVAERKQAQARLGQSEEKYRLLADNALDFIFRYRLNPDSRYEYVSPSISQVLGYEPEELYAEPLLHVKMIHPEDLSILTEYEQNPREIPKIQLFRWKHKDGHYVWMEQRVNVLLDASGQPWAIDGIARDVTDRLVTQKALEESEARLREVLTHSQDAAYRRNLATGVLDYASPAFEKITGYDLEEIKNLYLSDFSNLVHPEDAEHINMYLSYFLKHSDRQGRMEYRFKCKIGGYRWLEELFYTVRDRQSGDMFLVGSVRDITERKQAEQAAQKSRLESESQARRLEEANTALKVLLDQREEEKQRQAETVLGNVRRLVLPNLQKIRETSTHPEQDALLDVAEYYLNQITSQFSARLSSDSYGLTPREVEVANLVRSGKTTSDIASMLHVSENAVIFHRQNIRKKLGIHRKKINLVSYLRQLPH